MSYQNFLLLAYSYERSFFILTLGNHDEGLYFCLCHSKFFKITFLTFFIFKVISKFGIASGESWTGDGVLKCYGGFDIIPARPFDETVGTAQCRPTQWDSVSDPQAVFITGNDGTEWVS